MPAKNGDASALPTTEILAYWFGKLGDGTEIHMQLPQVRIWHAKNPEVDREIRAKFEAVFRAQRTLLLDDGQRPGTPRDRLALILLLDQFPRNMFRGTPGMYESDEIAVRLCQIGIVERDDEKLSLIERMFLYMPLMHAEDIRLQDQTVRLFEGLVVLSQTRSPQNIGFFRMALGFANKHRDIIARFGRYPHRNAILGRPSTDEEQRFLAHENSSF